MNYKSRNLIRIIAAVLMLSMLTAFAPALAESYSAAVMVERMLVYSDAYMTTAIGALNYHTIVTVLATKESVAQISYGGYTLYCDLGSLTAISAIGVSARFNQDSRVFESPSLSSRSAFVSAGMQVYVLAVQGNIAMVEKNAVVGYAYTGHLTREQDPFDPAQPENPTQPDQPSDPETPTTGDVITPTDGSVAIATIPAYVAQSSVNVYKSASTSSALLGSLSYGQSVTVRAYNDTWAYIELGGNYGFCALNALRKPNSTNPQPEPDLPQVDAIPAEVIADSMPVYESANTVSTVLGTLTKGVRVTVKAYNDTWAYIELNGRYGYCAISALQKLSDSQNEISKGQATVVAASAMFYESASTSSRATNLAIGTSVDVYSYDSTWVYCGYMGYKGYMLISALSAASYDELESGDSGAAVTQLETALLQLGYLDSVPGTSYNAQTTQAVQRLQAACGMTVNGVANTATQRVLFSGNAPYSPLLSLTLSKGAVSDNVKRIQYRLYALGYFSKTSSVDGDYGTNTAAAVKLFQSASGISASGTADSATIRAMYASNAARLPSGSKAVDASSGNSGGNSGGSSGGVNGNTATMPSNLASSTSSYWSGMSNAEKLEYVIYVGQNQLGKRYVYGSSGTATFDCSGFTMYCFKQIGITLAHSAYSVGYNNKYQKISSIGELKRGDLVFLNTVSDSDLCDHTGIYLGSNSFIHASSGAGKVVVSNLGSGYYNRVFSWGRRVLDT